MDDGLQDDWPDQIFRAYAVFGIEPSDTELASIWQRLKGRAIGHIQHAPLNIDFERLHPRDPLGRWRLKARAYQRLRRDIEEARRYDERAGRGRR